MNEIKVNMENLSESERETLLGLIEKSNGNKSKKKWEAKEGESYWYIGNAGNIYSVIIDSFDYCDNDRYNTTINIILYG